MNLLPEEFDREYYFFCPDLEVLHPDPFDLLIFYNSYFFQGTLEACQLKWSKRMTLCAGTCAHSSYNSCTITLSEALLKYRNANELKETLLHEMIHAYLFLTNPKCCLVDEGHGKEFKDIMNSINSITGLSISIFHQFHDEVEACRKHIWKCNGPCQYLSPYFGICKRAMNRPPQKSDNWFSDHQITCGGTFIKIEGPEFNNKNQPLKKTKKEKSYSSQPPFSKKQVMKEGGEQLLMDRYIKINKQEQNQSLNEDSKSITIDNINNMSIKSNLITIPTNYPLMTKDFFNQEQSLKVTNDNQNNNNNNGNDKNVNLPSFPIGQILIQKQNIDFADNSSKENQQFGQFIDGFNFKKRGNEPNHTLISVQEEDYQENFSSLNPRNENQGQEDSTLHEEIMQVKIFVAYFRDSNYGKQEYYIYSVNSNYSFHQMSEFLQKLYKIQNELRYVIIEENDRDTKISDISNLLLRSQRNNFNLLFDFNTVKIALKEMSRFKVNPLINQVWSKAVEQPIMQQHVQL